MVGGSRLKIGKKKSAFVGTSKNEPKKEKKKSAKKSAKKSCRLPPMCKRHAATFKPNHAFMILTKKLIISKNCHKNRHFYCQFQVKPAKKKEPSFPIKTGTKLRLLKN